MSGAPEKECVCCGQLRRIDRMSMHILEKHRDIIIQTRENKTLISECIRCRDGCMRIILRTDTGMEDYWISFAFNSGWTSKPKMKKVLQKIKDNRDAHIEVCESLLSDILAYAKEKKDISIKTSIDATPPTMELTLLTNRYEDLLFKYNSMEKKKNAIEASNERLRSMNRKTYDAINATLKLHDINHLLYSCIADEVNCIWAEYPEYPDDDIKNEENEQQRKKYIDAISLEEMHKNAEYANEDDF